MFIIPLGEFKKLGGKRILEIVPCIITVDGTEMFTLGKVEDTLALDDCHPRVKHILKAQYNKARVGMPQVVKRIWAEEIPKEIGS